MAELTPAQKAAGRMFRRLAEAYRAASVPAGAHVVPGTLRNVRHNCPRHGERTWGVFLQEWYLLSPDMVVATSGPAAFASDRKPLEAEYGELTEVPAGLFAYLWRQGRCLCGYTAVSDGGRIEDLRSRPLLHGARQEPAPW